MRGRGHVLRLALALALAACGGVAAPAHFAVHRGPPGELRLAGAPSLPDTPPPSDRVAEAPLEAIETSVLPNGVRVVSVVRRGFPVVATAVGLDRGLDDGPPGAALLSELSLDACKDDESERPCPYRVLYLTGASTAFDLDGEHAGLATLALSPLARASIRSVARIFVDPPLDPKALDREKEAQLFDRPDVRRGVAALAFRKRLLGEGHLAARRFQEHVEAARALTVADVKAWRARYLRPDEITVAVVGDLSHGAARGWVAEELGGLVRRAEPPPPGPLPGPLGAQKGSLALEDVKGLAQATVLVGVRAPSRDRSWPPELALLDTVLGQGVEGRLGRDLRRAYGSTYGAHVVSKTGGATGSIAVVADVEVGRVVEAVDAVRRLLADLARAPLPRDELTVAQRRLLARSRGLVTDDCWSAASDLLHLTRRGATLASRRALAAEAARFDPESFRAAVARWLVEDEVQVVVVGPAAQLAAPLAAAGYVAGRALPPVLTAPDAGR